MMTAVSTGHRCRFHSVCTNISLEDAEAGGGDHVCGQTRLCCVKVTTFYPGSAGLGWAGRVRCGLLHPDLTPAKPRRAATNQPPLASAKISPVFGSFSVSRSGSSSQRGCSAQIKSSCQVWKIKLLTASHCLHEEDVSIGV